MENINHTIKSCIRGDEKAQRELYLAYRTKWYMMAMRYGKNKQQADDIFQEGLIQIFNSLHQFDEKKAGFSTWSTRILIYSALKFLKKYNWVDSFKDIEEALTYEDTQENVYQKLAAKELTAIIQQLPLGYRLVFNLYAIEGYSHKEIAEELGISEGTSKSQLSKARKQLREKLESRLTKNYENNNL